MERRCFHPYLESVPVWLAVTPPQRHWEGSASRSNRSAGASVEIYIDWEHCPQALQYSSSPPLLLSSAPSPSPPLGLSNVVSTLQPGCNITTYTMLAKVRSVMAPRYNGHLSGFIPPLWGYFQGGSVSVLIVFKPNAPTENWIKCLISYILIVWLLAASRWGLKVYWLEFNLSRYKSTMLHLRANCCVWSLASVLKGI